MTDTTTTETDEQVLEGLEPSAGTPAIYGQVAEIIGAIGSIAKSGKGPAAQGGYAFMPVDEIVRQLNPLLPRFGVVVETCVLKEKLAYDSSPEISMSGQPTGRVNTKSRAKVRVRYTFVSVLDGSRLPAEVVGEAHDVADKALGKAETAAYKKALMRTFQIVAGEDDPDASDGTGPASEGVPTRRNRGQQRVDRARTRQSAPPTAPAAAPEDAAIAAVESARASVAEARASVAEARASIPQPEPTVPAPTVEEPTVGEPEEMPGGSNWNDPKDYAPDVRGGQTEAEAAELAARTEGAPRPRKQPRGAVPARSSDEPEPAWSPDPDDVAYAEAEAPKPPAPPATQADGKAASVAEIKSELRRAWSAKGMTRDEVNALGSEVTGKPLTQWMLNLTDLKRVLAAVEAR